MRERHVASFFYNDRRTNSGADAVIASLSAGDTITLGVDAVWAAINGYGLLIHGSSRTYVHGQVYGRAAIESRSTGVFVTVGSTGLLSGTDYGINAASGAGVTLVNDGHVYGATGANLGSAGGLVNNGTISGDTYGVRITLTYTISVSNTGTILGSAFYGLQMTGDQPFEVVNSGTIASRGYAVYISGVASFTGTLLNAGLIDGGVLASSARGATVRNTGTITGQVLLGAGDDLFDSTQGTLFGYVSGGDGADEILGSADGNDLRGAAGDDELSGMDGNDRLAGGAGADLLDGGTGRDLAAYFDAAAGVTVSLADPSRNTGAAAGDTFLSIEGLQGSAHNDSLQGDGKANRLLGGFGDDLLDGGAGADTLRGGFDDDIYLIDSVGDRVIERTDEGHDTVRTGIAGYVLPDHVEDLELTGTRAINGTGNTLANALTGNGAANVLAGRGGADTLTGGAGADVFVLDTAFGADQIDTITDFASREDRIRLSRAIFTELNGGTELAAARFVLGSAAGDANDRILFHKASGAVFYDADGTGAVAAVQILQLDPGTALVATDFQLVA